MRYRLLLLLALPFLAIAQQPSQTFIQCGKLIDGVSSRVRSNVTIVVSGNRISGVQDGLVNGGADDKVVNLQAYTVMPGLIDCHVHLEHELSKTSRMDRFTKTDADVAYFAQTNARKTLMAGFTTVRDLGGSGVNIALRKAIRAGLVDGPNMITAGVAISATGGHMDESDGLRDDALRHTPGPEDGVADGKDELIKAVRFQFKKGADLIKIASTGGVLDLSKDGSGAQFSVEEIRAVVETAKDYGMVVACHAHGAEGIKRAILGGVKSIEHGTFMDEEGMRLAKEHGVWLVPTIIAGKSVADSARNSPGFFPAVIIPKAIQTGDFIQKNFARAYKAGVKIAFGTDAGVYPHGKNWLEFQYMTEAGMPAIEAIQCATSRAAELLGMASERGRIASDFFADIIAVNGDPLADISSMGKVVFVMKEGKIYKQ